jgi:hypothetical protein
MTNLMKKLSALVLALALLLTVCAGAMAEDPANSIDDTSLVGAEGNTVSWTDTFRISSGDNAQNLPAATFNYAIAPGTGAAATATTPLIKDGLAGATISNAEHAATASGTTTDSVLVTADFTNVTFTEAGIYRYNVTETLGTTNVPNDIDIDVNNSNHGTYTLDVYVKRDGEAFKIYGYVLAKVEAEITYDNSKDPQTVVYGNKVQEIINEYTTYDLTVSKTIVGDMAANEFNFTISLTNVPTDVIFTQTKDGATADNTGAASYTLTATLSNGETTVIKGLPSAVTYAIREAVNQLEGYTVTVSDNNPNKGDYGWIVENAISTTSLEATENGNPVVTTIGENDTTVAFTNTLKSISPTGVVLRVAPYILILGAGLALLVLSHKRRHTAA